MNSQGDGEESEPSPCKYRRKEQTNNENSCQMMIDNSSNVLKILSNLYHERTMCDVFLTVGSTTHAAHRLILCASSDVFQAMLMNPEWSEWHESKVVLKELPQCEAVFHNFLEYLYTGKIIITHTNVMALLSLADKYIVRSLTKLCLEYMLNHVPHAASHNVLFSWLQYTVNCGHTEVAEICINFIKWNLEAVANNPEFSELDVELLVNLLQKNDLVVYNEMMLYNCVTRWLDLQKIKLVQSKLPKNEVEKHMDHLVEVVMSYIRFPMMSPRELADLLLSPLTKQYKEFFVDRMAIGMTFHSGQEERIQMICNSEEGRLLFTPRLYTSDCFSAILLVENVLSLPCYHVCTFVFSSHMSAAECESDKINEWVVDLYPKGVWFKKCALIIWQGTLEVPEEILTTVRLSLTCQELTDENKKVRVGLLLYARQGDTDHIMKVIERVHYFNSKNKVLNIDNIIPFEELNYSCHTRPNYTSPYLIGPNKDKLKINIVITPLSPDSNGKVVYKSDGNCSLLL